MTHTHHAIDYIEIGVADLGRARGFYADAFGWSFNDYGPTYAGIRGPDGSGEVGGLNGEGSSPAGGPLVLLYSEDLEATLASVQAAGGTVVDEPFEFPGGRRFHFADPDGNRLGAWTAG
jgi:predicted enzyme related to lactoylglutathione lyase